MSKNNMLRISTGGEILNSVAKAGTLLNGPSDPGAGTSGNTEELRNASNYTTYIDQETAVLYRKENGIWINSGAQVGPPGAGFVTGGINAGPYLPSQAGNIYKDTVAGLIQFRQLHSTDGSVECETYLNTVDIRVPGVVKSNYDATTDPTSSDDSSPAKLYKVGSAWVNKNNQQVWRCVDDTVGAAVWVKVSNVQTVAGAPSVNTDDSNGYKQGDIYIDQATSNVYICDDASNTAAVWRLIANNEGVLKWDKIKQNLPTSNTRLSFEMSNNGVSHEIKNDYNESGTNYIIPDGTFTTAGGNWVTGSRYVEGTNGLLWSCTDGQNGAWDSSMLMGAAFRQQYQNTYDINADFVYALSFADKDTINDAKYRGNNFNSNRDPNATDDDTKGYIGGSIWWNQASKNLWLYDTIISDWVKINSNISLPSNPARWGYQGTPGSYPTLTGSGNPGTVDQWRIVNLGGVNQDTWTTKPGNVNPNFENGNPSVGQTLSLKYIGPSGLFQINWSLALNVGNLSMNATLWKDTNANTGNFYFNSNDPQIADYRYCATMTAIIRTYINVSCSLYLNTNDYIGIAVNLNGQDQVYTGTIERVDIALLP